MITVTVSHEDPADALVVRDAAMRLTNASAREALLAVAAALESAHAAVAVTEATTLTPREAAALLGVSRQYVDKLINDGRLAASRKPGSTHRVIRTVDLDAYLTHRAGTTSKMPTPATPAPAPPATLDPAPAATPADSSEPVADLSSAAEPTAETLATPATASPPAPPATLDPAAITASPEPTAEADSAPEPDALAVVEEAVHEVLASVRRAQAAAPNPLAVAGSLVADVRKLVRLPWRVGAR